MISHKRLKSISHNFGHSFISLMNYIHEDYVLGHLLKQARITGLNKLTVDILNQKIEPANLLTNPVRISIERYIKWFPELVTTSGSTMDFITSAIMTIEFDLNKTKVHSTHTDVFENPYSCEMKIIDDRGKDYRYLHAGWWYPET